jgi:histidine triad (HIT) family protein
MMDCLFCKIVSGEIPATIIYRDEKVIAFNDINPQAPQHVLIVPHKHIATLNDLQVEDNELLGHMTQTAKNLAKKFGIAEAGYRLVMNCNADGGQTVFHIHMHLLGGRQLTWPPG